MIAIAILIAVSLGMLIAGFAFIPTYIKLLATPFGNNILGKGMFILGQLAHGGSMIYYEGDGTVSIYMYDRETNRVFDGEKWYDVNDDPTTYRFGWAPVVVDCDPEASAPGNTLVDKTQLPRSAATDGGAEPIGESRGGMPLFSDADVSEPVIHFPRYLQQMGRDGNELINRAKERALEKYGGEAQTSQTTWAALILAGYIVVFAMTFGLLLVM